MVPGRSPYTTRPAKPSTASTSWANINWRISSLRTMVPDNRRPADLKRSVGRRRPIRHKPSESDVDGLCLWRQFCFQLCRGHPQYAHRYPSGLRYTSTQVSKFCERAGSPEPSARSWSFNHRCRRARRRDLERRSQGAFTTAHQRLPHHLESGPTPSFERGGIVSVIKTVGSENLQASFRISVVRLANAAAFPGLPRFPTVGLDFDTWETRDDTGA
jgi:hypothetical protein